jgi:excisionase family DNA binding protein
MPDKLMHDVGEAAEQTGLGRSTLYELMRSGRLGSVKVGSRRLIPAAELQRFVESLERGE